MTIIDIAILLAGGISLAILVGYSSWVQLRVLMLKTEILEPYALFKGECQSLNAESDPAYQEMCDIFDTFLDSADKFSLPFLAFTVSVRKKDDSEHVRLVTTNTGLAKVINRATESLAHVVVYHVTHRTFSGGIMYLLLRIVPRSVVKSEARQVVKKAIGPLQGFHQNGRFSHC